MRITVLLGGSLGEECAHGHRERDVEMVDGARVGDLVGALGLAPERVRLILVNGRGATLDAHLGEGDRVALVPPELSFNTFVSLSFRKERVEAREQTKGQGGP
jgi:sulfur carrier protein ThiS